MCNDYQQHIAWKQYCELMQKLELGIPTQQTELDLPKADDIRINDMAPVMRTSSNVIELTQMRWSFPPARLGGKPVFNFRSEGRTFGKEQRVLVPASGFFEFVGTRTPKSKFLFTLNGAPFKGNAGIWRPGSAGEPNLFTMLTTAPGPDIERYHDRQAVVLRPEHWASWLYHERPGKELLRPLSVGSLSVELVRQGKDELDPALFD